jgi:hypothetical protein
MVLSMLLLIRGRKVRVGKIARIRVGGRAGLY